MVSGIILVWFWRTSKIILVWFWRTSKLKSINDTTHTIHYIFKNRRGKKILIDENPTTNCKYTLCQKIYRFGLIFFLYEFCLIFFYCFIREKLNDFQAILRCYRPKKKWWALLKKWTLFVGIFKKFARHWFHQLTSNNINILNWVIFFFTCVCKQNGYLLHTHFENG